MRKALIAMGTLSVLAMLGGFLMPGSWHVERQITINAPVERVFPWLVTLSRWPDWAMPLKGMSPTFYGGDGAVGARMSWRDPRSGGQGSLRVVEVVPNARVRYELRFSENDTRPGRGTLSVRADGTGSVVTWADDGDMGMNPVARYAVPALTKSISNDMDIGLHRLKQNVEAAP